jgi:two-component system, LytTR family, sensor kinase
MRFTLYENHVEVLPLEREIEVMKEYIALERLRSAKDFISVEINGILDGIYIAPMVLLTFVENAIKYSDGQKIENAVIVKITVGSDSHVEFFCRNIIAKRQTQTNGGIGLDLIKSRLNLLYPNKHDLLLSEKDGYFDVKLTILP